MLSRSSCLPVILIVALGWLAGCNSLVVVGDPDNSGVPNSNSEEGAGLGNTPEEQPEAPPEEPLEPGDEALPDFLAVDANVDSARYQEAVSPRDYLGRVSAWYFGHST